MGLLCSALLCSALQAMNYGLDHAMSFTKRTQEWKLWLIFFAVEHGIMMLRVMLLAVAPPVPKWIAVATETLEYRIRNVFKTPEAIRMEELAREMYMQQLNDFRDGIRHKLTCAQSCSLSTARRGTDSFLDPRLGRMEMLDVFESIDVDHNGDIDRHELLEFYSLLQVATGVIFSIRTHFHRNSFSWAPLSFIRECCIESGEGSVRMKRTTLTGAARRTSTGSPRPRSMRWRLSTARSSSGQGSHFLARLSLSLEIMYIK
jgi:hypothetical protein